MPIGFVSLGTSTKGTKYNFVQKCVDNKSKGSYIPIEYFATCIEYWVGKALCQILPHFSF